MNIHDQIRSNQRRSILLVIIFFCLIGVLSAFLGIFLGNIIFGLVIGMIFAVIYTIIVFNSGGNMVLTRQELEGVIAHEMSHIKNQDIKVMMLAAVLVGITVLISDFLLRSLIFGKRDDEAGNAKIVLIIVG